MFRAPGIVFFVGALCKTAWFWVFFTKQKSSNWCFERREIVQPRIVGVAMTLAEYAATYVILAEDEDLATLCVTA